MQCQALQIKRKLEMVFMKHYAPNFNFTYRELIFKQNFTYMVVKLCYLSQSMQCTNAQIYKGP